MKLTARLLLLTALLTLPLARVPVARGAGQKEIGPNGSDAERLARLEKQLETLRQELRIPALSAAVVKDQRVLWAKGFGFADVENKVAATEHTPYHLASLTKTFASTVIMRLVEEGKIKLDDPVSKYGVAIESEGVVRVRHLLSHTSEGNPGERYRYNGNRFGELDKVVERATGEPFATHLIRDILDPLGMSETAPNVPTAVATKPAGAPDAKAEAEVKEAVAKLLAAYNSENFEEMERMVAPQQNGFRPEGGFLGPILDPNLRGAFRAGYKLDVKAHDLDVAVYGDTALATLVITGVVTPPPGDERPRYEGPWRTSYLWHRQGGAWRLAHAHQSPLGTGLVSEKHRQRFEAVSKTLAQAYGLDNKFQVTKIKYPTYFGTSAGLIASVLDMAKYDIAVDQHKFLKRETQRLAFTPTVSTKGDKLPYGLGWFTQDYKGRALVWHYGYWMGNSSLILKVPERNLTFIAMANTDNLSRPTDLGSGDVLSSPVGLAFLKSFVLPELFGEPLAEIDWKAAPADLHAQLKQAVGRPYADVYTKELLVHARKHGSVGELGEAARLYKVYGDLYGKELPDGLGKRQPLAEIKAVGNDADKTVEFAVAREQRVRVFATGEGIAGQMYDYGWIENAETGRRVWEMKLAETAHAGGHDKNRKADALVTLPAGKYKLRYKSDDSHSHDNWNSLPPDFNFWGIALYGEQ
ncbi:MAG TPA: serine hydrolase [Pyrinomonadaceae bacterium]|nr:serine hydrolase [Pyrinomonadaceae bacterium]